MIKYEVKTFDVETKNGENVLIQWQEQSTQDMRLVKSFDTLDDAKKLYETIPTSCEYMSGYYLSKCKCIEQNEYDEDGEWIAGGDWWLFEVPEKKG